MSDAAPSGGAPSPTAVVNGEPMTLPRGATVAWLVERYCASDRGVAVAVDREIVARSRWADTAVPDGALVEIVTAAAGG